MKIGIVGGTGNISQSIVRLLLEKGYEVICFHRGQKIKAPKGVRLIQGDRRNRADFEQKMQAEKLFRDVPEFHPQISLEQGMTQS